jgi:4-amino-4-deoxy-L-arabinose transferase-like glycosyltransferase
MQDALPQSGPPRRLWSPRSIAILVLAWLILQIGGLFTPGLLDDVDSVYIEIAREMLHRHDYVTPYINGVRFFDKPPLMYWMAAGSMHIFGIHDWAARLPLALAVLALLLSVYGLGIRLFVAVSPPASPDRAGFYAALALATSIGPYLYTRFYIPDILLALWMTLAVHLFLIALDRIHAQNFTSPKTRVPHRGLRQSLRRSLIAAKVGNRESNPLSPTQHKSAGAPSFAPFAKGGNVKSPLLPCLAFAAVMALNVLTKGLIGLVFPIGFVLLYLAVTKQLRLLLRLHPIASAAVFLALAAPWHILAALRNPAVALPPGLGLPATGGWAWFYLYNEHIARFLSKRIPHDYGQTPIWLFWLFTFIWIMPWAAFIPASIPGHIRSLRRRQASLVAHSLTPNETIASKQQSAIAATQCNHQAALALLLWTGLVLGFFTLSARQEYYALPAIPALALLAAGALAVADNKSSELPLSGAKIRSSIFRWSAWLLLPLGAILALVCGYYALTAPHPAPGTDIISLLTMSGGTETYNLSLSHVTDLTARAMGLFRGPLAATALGMLAAGPISYLLRRRGLTYAANLTLAAAMTLTLLAAHEGLTRFYPILGSKPLAEAINHARQTDRQPNNDLILIDGELTSGSSLIFYTGQQVHLLNGRVNGLWYGSFWPDAPAIFETESTLRQLWSSPRRIFLFTYNPAARTNDLAPYSPIHTLASAGGKTILTNH